MAKSLRGKVEEHLTCSVCLEPFKDPKVLPCLHSYCHGCIVNLAKNDNTNTVKCPECRLVVEVDRNAVCSLPSNFFVNNLLATMALTSDNSTAKEVVCDNCESEDAAQSRCSDCGIFLCQFCTESHKRSRSTKQHKLLTVEELKSNPGPQKIADNIHCPKHKDEIVKLFCKTCQTTICRDCTIVDHRQHEYAFVEEVAVEKKQHLQSNLEKVKERKEKVIQGMVNLKNFYESLEAKKKSTIAEISHHFDQLAKAVESRKVEMVEQATSLTNGKQKQIHAQLEVLEVALASCDSSIEFTERAFNSGNDVQILSMAKCILQSLEQLKAVKDQTKPCVAEDMMFVIPSSVQETKETLLHQYYVDVSVASPENCQASFKEEELMFDAGKQYSITLICLNQDNQRLKWGGQDVKPSFFGTKVGDVVVIDNKDGSHTISFRLRQGGMLKFEVSINGIPAPNCSLTKQVRWVISDVKGKGVITNGGLTMKSVGGEGEYCCWIGGCYFESGVHTWTVKLSFQESYDFDMEGNQFGFPPNQGMFAANSRFGMFGQRNVLPFQQDFPDLSVEVGIIDCDAINERDIAQSERKCIYKLYLDGLMDDSSVISLTLDVENRTLHTRDTSDTNPAANSYPFLACRVSPFFACNSPHVSISMME